MNKIMTVMRAIGRGLGAIGNGALAVKNWTVSWTRRHQKLVCFACCLAVLAAAGLLFHGTQQNVLAAETEAKHAEIARGFANGVLEGIKLKGDVLFYTTSSGEELHLYCSSIHIDGPLEPDETAYWYPEGTENSYKFTYAKTGPDARFFHEMRNYKTGKYESNVRLEIFEWTEIDGRIYEVNKTYSLLEGRDRSEELESMESRRTSVYVTSHAHAFESDAYENALMIGAGEVEVMNPKVETPPECGCCAGCSCETCECHTPVED